MGPAHAGMFQKSVHLFIVRLPGVELFHPAFADGRFSLVVDGGTLKRE